MTEVEGSGLFLMSVPVYMIWLISLGKLGSIFLQKRDGSVWRYGGCLCLLAAARIGTAGNYMVYSVSQQTLLMLFLFVLFHGNWWEKSGLSCVLVAVWEFVWNGIEAALSICEILFAEHRTPSYVMLAVSFLCTLACMYMLFGRTKLAEGSFLRGGKMLFLVSGLLLILIDLCNFGITRGIVVVSDNGAQYWDITHNELLTHLEVLTVSVLCLVICLSLLFGTNRLIGYIAVDNLRKMEISRYQGILEQYRKQANVRHDLKNHFICMSALAEQGEWDRLKEYLSKICSAGLIGDRDIETGNSVVNAILNTKRQTAEQRGIAFDCSVNITKPLAIDEYDLCIVWGNILDNAIMAADTAEEKFVYVQAEIVKKNLVVSVKNSAASVMLQSDFGRKDWGTGLKNVDKIVRKEKGILDIRVTDTAFEISILLPVAV